MNLICIEALNMCMCMYAYAWLLVACILCIFTLLVRHVKCALCLVNRNCWIFLPASQLTPRNCVISRYLWAVGSLDFIAFLNDNFLALRRDGVGRLLPLCPLAGCTWTFGSSPHCGSKIEDLDIIKLELLSDIYVIPLKLREELEADNFFMDVKLSDATDIIDYLKWYETSKEEWSRY